MPCSAWSRERDAPSRLAKSRPRRTPCGLPCSTGSSPLPAMFRLRLAEHMIAADTRRRLRRALALSAGRPWREPAGTSCSYQSDRPDRAAAELLERHFLEQSSAIA